MEINKVKLNSTGNSGVIIEAEGKIIYIDPYQLKITDKKADIILITHPHYDHCSVADISAIVKQGSVIVVPPGCQSKITRLKQEVDMQVVEIGDEISLQGIKIKVVPAYNLNKQFHPKSERWHGYVLSFEEVQVYHAGDTDLVPEMSKLVGFHNLIALLPVGGNYTMNAEEAAKAASIIKPKIAVPMHYGVAAGSIDDAEKFVQLCKQEGIEARRIDN